MKVLVLSDIHSNWPALSAVDESFDAGLFLGDLVDYATDPAPCIEWVRGHADARVRGNHDHAVAQRVAARGRVGLRRLSAATRPHHWETLSAAQTKFLARLPVSMNVRLAQHTFYLVHATPRDPFDEYLTDDAELWEERLVDVEADFVCVGHSHVPFHIDLGRTQVINPGSIGQPRDGDPRAAYAVIEDGKVELRRVAYDIDATLTHMRECGVDSAAVEIAEAVLKTGGQLPEFDSTPPS
ncbi:MAG: YfcE family phosphodiesterase [Planctomycetaceae bacterium]|nr:YfcE family phosphodiesterase [Planctomycetaceae bacterium]